MTAEQHLQSLMMEGAQWAWVEGFDHAYAVTTEGRVFSLKAAEPRQLSVHDGGKVKLYRHGKRYRPMASSLVNRTFYPEETAAYSSADLAWYLRTHYGGHEVDTVRQWATRAANHVSDPMGEED